MGFAIESRYRAGKANVRRSSPRDGVTRQVWLGVSRTTEPSERKCLILPGLSRLESEQSAGRP